MVLNREKVIRNTYYINIYYYYIRHLTNKGIIKILYIDTDKIAADSFIKLLEKVKFNKFQNLIRIIKGSIKESK